MTIKWHDNTLRERGRHTQKFGRTLAKQGQTAAETIVARNTWRRVVGPAVEGGCLGRAGPGQARSAARRPSAGPRRRWPPATSSTAAALTPETAGGALPSPDSGPPTAGVCTVLDTKTSPVCLHTRAPCSRYLLNSFRTTPDGQGRRWHSQRPAPRLSHVPHNAPRPHKHTHSAEEWAPQHLSPWRAPLSHILSRSHQLTPNKYVHEDVFGQRPPV